MAEAVLDPAELPAEPVGRRGARYWFGKLLKGLATLLIGLILAFVALVAFLDTGPGHR